MKEKPSDKLRLIHMLETIQYIFAYTADVPLSAAFFENNTLVRHAVERQLEVIGEAANHVTDSLKSKHNDVPWRKVVAFRNFLSHEYFGIDPEIILTIVTVHIPELKSQIEHIWNQEFGHEH